MTHGILFFGLQKNSYPVDCWVDQYFVSCVCKFHLQCTSYFR